MLHVGLLPGTVCIESMINSIIYKGVADKALTGSVDFPPMLISLSRKNSMKEVPSSVLIKGCLQLASMRSLPQIVSLMG